MAKNDKNNNMMYILGAAVVIIIIALLLFTGKNVTPQTASTTVVNNSNGTLATVTVTSLVSTIVANLTTATGPNLATCNGYNFSIAQAYYSVVGSCNWRGGLLNLTIFGGSFDNDVLTLIQQNTTSTPFNATTGTMSCLPSAGAFFVPGGNYQVTFTTGGASTSNCGSSTVRISIS